MMYQPIPLRVQRRDCEERYQTLCKYMKPHNATLIDICCANGYFGFRFMQEGGKRVVGIENNIAYVNLVNTLAEIEQINFECRASLPKEVFEYAIYLDTDGEVGTSEYLGFIKAHVKKAAFISSAKDNDGLKEKLSCFSSCTSIYCGFNGRVIYKCS